MAEAEVTGPSRRRSRPLGEPAVSPLQPRNQLAEVQGPADAHDAIGEDARIVGIPVGIAKALERRKAKVIGDARYSPVPGALALRLAQLLRDRGQREEEDGSSQQAIDLHAYPAVRPWKPRLGRSSRRLSIDFA